MNGRSLILTGPELFNSGNLALAIGVFGATETKEPKNSASAALSVDDLPEAIKFLKSKKVKIVNEPAEFPPCHMAIIEDPDGNQISPCVPKTLVRCTSYTTVSDRTACAKLHMRTNKIGDHRF